mgnify:CR=1 FL=1
MTARAPAITLPASPTLTDVDPVRPSTPVLVVAATKREEPPSGRLVVLVPWLDRNLAEFAAQIQALAAPRELPVLLVAQSDTARDLWATRRSLTTLAALIAAPHRIQVDLHVSPTREWLKILPHVITAGDVVVCAQGQADTGRWLRRPRPLAEVIRDRFQVPVCVLTELSVEAPAQLESLATRVRAWVVPIAVIILFGFLQVQIEVGTEGWVTSALLCGTAIIEIIILAL